MIIYCAYLQRQNEGIDSIKEHAQRQPKYTDANQQARLLEHILPIDDSGVLRLKVQEFYWPANWAH